MRTWQLLPDGSACGLAMNVAAADAYAWRFCWKVWDVLRNAAYNGIDLDVALGDAPAHRNNDSWNDGVSIAPLTIQDEAPINP